MQIRRPDPTKPFGYDVRGTFEGVVQEQQAQLNTDLSVNLTERRFVVTSESPLPIEPLTDSSDPNFGKDVQKDDHLIRLRFFSDADVDTEAKLKDIDENVLQISYQPEERAGQMSFEATELGSL